jgi:hypothetical protein
MKKILLLLIISLGLIACSEKELDPDYYISAGKFYTPSGEIRTECFANFMAELNGDNYIASINVPLCQSADIPYAYGSTDTKKGDIRYTIEKELKNHKYRLNVCQKVDGSIGGYCDEIVIQFNTRDFERDDVTIGKNPLYIDYLGDEG